MPINTYVAGNPQSCYTCATQVDAFGRGMDDAAQGFTKSRDSSGDVWKGDAGDAFRDRISEMKSGTADVAERARSASEAIATFGDGLTNAKAQMRQAAEVAASAGIAVQPNTCDPEWIMDPQRPIAIGPMTTADEAKFAAQCAAYAEALGMVIGARGIEKDTHSRLKDALHGVETALDDARKGKWWLLASAGAGHVNAAVMQADKWSRIAADHSEQAARFRHLADEAIKAGDPFWESKYLGQLRHADELADDAARVVAANAKLVGGAIDNAAVRFAAGTAGDYPGVKSVLGEVGGKIPALGVAVTGWQTYTELGNAQDKGDVVEIVGKNVGGFVAGTVATELLLVSAAGGPATFAAVAVGVGVAWGTSEIIDHWDSIAGWVTAS